MNTNEFKNKLEIKYPNKFEVLGEYINSKTPIHIKCIKCGSEYYKRPSHIMSGRNCIKCANRKKKTTEEFKKEIYDLVGNEYTILSEYKGCHIKIDFIHNKCGYKFSTTPNTFLNIGCRCPKCNNRYSKTNEEFIKEIYDLVKDEYTVLEDYNGCHNKIKFKHNKCNNIFNMTPRHFLNGCRCPNCKHSIPEDIIEKYLIDNNYYYDKQIYFDDCRLQLPLKFDFKIFIENNSYILLEYDGEFHYENKFSEAKLKLQQKRDKIKNDYCKNNDIILERINYTKRKYLIEELNKLNNKYKFLERSETIETIDSYELKKEVE